ncbi:MAG: hypothetical protein EHM14_15860 [Methanothrix sp.]|nr:MAG: hypothetical protein EHM14_15860 [Methanothrix sp.]
MRLNDYKADSNECVLAGAVTGEYSVGDIVKMPNIYYTYPKEVRGKLGRITSMQIYHDSAAKCRIRLKNGKLIRAFLSDTILLK